MEQTTKKPKKKQPILTQHELDIIAYRYLPCEARCEHHEGYFLKKYLNHRDYYFYGQDNLGRPQFYLRSMDDLTQEELFEATKLAFPGSADYDEEQREFLIEQVQCDIKERVFKLFKPHELNLLFQYFFNIKISLPIYFEPGNEHNNKYPSELGASIHPSDKKYPLSDR